MPFKFNPFTGNFDQTGSGGGGGASYIDGEVQNFSALPQTVGSPAVDSAYLVREAEGTWLLNRKPAGIYIRTANTGTRASDWTYAGEFPDVFNDANFVLYDDADSTKNAKFQLSSIATGTTRTITVPNKNVTLDDAGDSRTPTAHSHTLASEITTALAQDPDNCRDALGLGDMATEPSSNFAQAGHAHAASDITSGTLTHERGGLEADVSAYSGLLKISGGATSAVTVTTAGEALIDDADAAAQRTTLGLGGAATLSVGTTAGTVAAGDDSRFHTRSHAMTGTSDHTSSNWSVFYSNGSGQVTELALGAANTVLTSNGTASAPSFAAASGGGASAMQSIAINFVLN